jgi:cytochrome c biogenesis protein CcmG/thiol:disulfide interchange protein DsbE
MKRQQYESMLIHCDHAAQWIVVLWCATALSMMAPVIAWSQHDHHAGQSSVPSVGNPAIPFELKSLDGQSVVLASFRGKPLVVNFFASWCDPCRDEMPLINELASKATKSGYSVLGIAVEDSRAAVTEYAREAKLVFPIALDLNSTVKRSYRIFGPPATFFIDHQGIIRDIVVGPITPERARDGLTKAGVIR